MWLQQKYMPKPGQEARKEALAKRAAEHKAKPDKPAGLGQMSPEDQLRQQQMMANIMAVMFPLMFYNQPSGLALYWFFTNIFGICESLIIRKQIREEKERLAREGPRKPDPNRKPGLVGGLFKRFTDQMVAWQKQADELSQHEKERASKHDRDNREKRK
jgi:membrane protein insertase Oxa1/YidC/SpoIIIJ